MNEEGWIVVYNDDIVIKGKTIPKVWERMLLVIKRLHNAGFEINLNKTVLLATLVEMVGY